ncbi:MAG: hypothetical protein KDA71_06860 [Planctomycetales bacterium]|nr:hypothetical protein [Planctomycetales bacterium]
MSMILLAQRDSGEAFRDLIFGGGLAVGFVALAAFILYRHLAGEKSKAAAKDAAERLIARLVSAIQSEHSNRELHEQLLAVAGHSSAIAARVYSLALQCVEASRGGSAARQFALSAGRLAYGLKRKRGRPTVYDEQAIANDIESHAAVS